VPGRPNQQWGTNCVSDTLASGRRIRLFTVVDVFTREALAIEVETSLPGARVVRVLERLGGERRAPDEIVLDNGRSWLARLSASGPTRGECRCASLSQASPSGTPSSRVSRDGSVMSVWIAIGSFASLMPCTMSRSGGRATIECGPTVRSVTGRQWSSGSGSTRLRSGSQSGSDSHTAWTTLMKAGHDPIEPAGKLRGVRLVGRRA
jgi:hypothetical protein